MVVIEKLKTIFFSGHERSIKAKKNIIALALLKGYSVTVNLSLIPLTLHLLDDFRYGVWIILFNILSWISIFDIGIGNGLRNKFAEAMAKGELQDAKKYVSTGYVILGAISLGLLALFIIPWTIINWAAVFNVGVELKHEITLLVGISFLLTCVQFALKLIDTILTADHRPATAGVFSAISSTIILFIFLLAKNTLANNMLLIGTIYSLVPTIVFFAASIYYFNGIYRNIRPAFADYDKNKVNGLFSVGIQFFIIQIAVLIIFQTDSLIIAHVLSPEQVTPYNIVFRYFGVITMLVSIVMTPLWSAYTEAAAKDDYVWIRHTLYKQLKLFGLIVLFIIIMSVFARPVIKLWLHKELNFSNNLLIGMAIYTLISVWNNIYAFLLNGLSITRLQMITSIFGATINIPLSIFLAKQYGNGGVIFGTILSLSFFAVFGSIQAFHVIKLRVK